MRNTTRRDLLTRVIPGVTAVATLDAIASPAASFLHGVASGDPTADAVILWSRVTPRFSEATEVTWTLARDPEFVQIFRSGTVITDGDRDFTVKVDVTGLPADTHWFYRFSALGAQSVAGRTRTLPLGAVDVFTVAVCSCSNYPAGYFNAYRHISERDDIDLVLHLGDYLYEYPEGGYASEQAAKLWRLSVPGHETASLADYRARHAQYKTDPDLQSVHARYPFMVTWDDHESANDSWSDGAQNHSQEEGSWALRKSMALQAYYEWMPIREPKGRPLVEQWRAAQIGNLATIVMLETRLSARDRQVNMGQDMRYRSAPYDFSNPEQPQPATTGSATHHIRQVKLPFNVSVNPPAAITDYARIKAFADMSSLPEGIAYLPDTKAFRQQVLDKEGRSLLGNSQRQFVADQLERSINDQTVWQIFGNQTLVAPITAPDVSDAYSNEQLNNLPQYVRGFVTNTQYDLPFGTDSWNGYGAERRWFLNQNAASNSHMIVLTGDTHAAWGLNLTTKDYPDWQGIELGTTAISSPGYTQSFQLPAAQIEKGMKAANPHLHYSDVAHRGYLTLTLEPEQATARFYKMASVSRRTVELAGADEFTIRPGHSGVRWDDT